MAGPRSEGGSRRRVGRADCLRVKGRRVEKLNATYKLDLQGWKREPAFPVRRLIPADAVPGRQEHCCPQG